MPANWGELGALSYWIDLGERTLRSFAQTVGAALLAGTALQPVVSMPWLDALSIGASAAVLCVLTGLGSIAIPGNDPATASALPPPKRAEQ